MNGTEIDPLARMAKVPPFILQPLIENAIIHGIGPYSDSGQLNINAVVHKDRLEITIEDDGVGLPAKSFKEGIGLNNIRSRLKNLYENNFKFFLRNGYQKGTVAIVDLPLIYNEI